MASKRVSVLNGAYIVGINPEFGTPRYFVQRVDVDPSLQGARPTKHDRLVNVIARFSQHGYRLHDADVYAIATLAAPTGGDDGKA